MAQTSYFLRINTNNVATTWMTNFWPMQERVPDPKERNAALSFGSFKSKESISEFACSLAEPENNDQCVDISDRKATTYGRTSNKVNMNFCTCCIPPKQSYTQTSLQWNMQVLKCHKIIAILMCDKGESEEVKTMKIR